MNLRRLVLALLLWPLLIRASLGAAASDEQVARAEALVKEGRAAEAVALCNQWVEADPRDSGALLARARAHQALGNTAAAAADLDRAVEVAPTRGETWRRRALFRLAQKQFTEAQADAEEALKLAPNDGSVHAARGAVGLVRKNYTAAVADFTRALELKPGNAVYLSNRGAAREGAGDADGALGDFEAATASNPGDTYALGRQAAIYESRGRTADALKAYKAILRVAPQHKVAGAKVEALQSAGSLVGAPSSKRPDAPPRAATPSRSAVTVTLPKVAPPKRIQFANLPGSVYESAVSAGMEGMKLVLAPATEEENTRIEQLWAPAFRFPCAEVVDYLNTLNPLLAEFLAYRSTAAYVQVELSRANAEALQMAALDQDTAVETAMAEVRAQAQRLADLRAALEKTSNAIRALGDPPDASELMGRARKRADQAYRYGQAEQPESDLEYVHRANFISAFMTGSVRVVGDHDGSAHDIDKILGGLITHRVPVRWSGDEFFYSGPTHVFNRKSDHDINTAGSHLLIGKVSPDGRRLLSLRGSVIREDGRVSAYELRDIDLRHREQSFSPTTLFLSTYSLAPSYSSASLAFRSTVRLLHLGEEWGSATDLNRRSYRANVTEFRPTSLSVALFHDPDVAPDVSPTQSLTAVRSKLDEYWKRPNSWARVTALSEEKWAALFPQRGTAPPKPPPAPPPTQPPKNQAEEDLKERIASLEKDIEYIQADLRSIRKLTGGDRDYIQFLLDAKESEILSKRDLIASLRSGQYVHTRTPFDDRTRAQLIEKCEAEVRQLAGMDHERRTNDALAAKLDPGERDALQKRVQELVASPEALNPDKWRELNAMAYGQVQARYEREKKAADDEVAVWDNRIYYAEWVKSGAGTGFSLLAGGGGYKAAELVYLFGTSSLEGGLGKYYETGNPVEGLKRGVFEGGKAVITKVSDTVDYAWTAADVYMANPQAKPSERMADVATALASKYATSKAMGVVNEQAAAFLAQSRGKPAWKPGGREAIAAMKHKQQIEMDQALVKDFIETDRQYRRAVATRAPAADLQRLRAEVERKTFSVHASYGAKIIMKHQVQPADQRNFVRILREAHEELAPQLVSELRAGRTVNGQTTNRYDGQLRFVPIRNASSGDSAGIDFDLALVEHARYRRGPDGKLTPNVWLTRDGAPASPDALRQDAQQIWNRLYRQRTGYSATVSMENITVSTQPESYADRAWINVREGRFTTPPDPAWAQQAADVTRFKANEMQQKESLLLGHYQRRQEASRGTAKDISTKLQTALRTTASQQGGKWSPEQRRKHDDVVAFWSEAETVLRRFGQGEIDPLEAERQIHLLSGGRGLDDLIDRAGTAIEGYTKASAPR